MSVDLQQRNAKYLEYLLDVGVIDSEQHESMVQKCVDLQEKKLLFEISNTFANFTASDWFDLSCRIYNNWGKNPPASQRVSAPQQTQSQNANSQREQEEEEEYEREHEEEVQDVRIYGNQKRTASAAEAPKASRPQGSNIVINNSAARKIGNLCQVIEEYAYQTQYADLKSHFDHFRFAVSNASRYDSEAQEKYLTQKGNRSVRQSERSNRNTGEKDWHNKLYFDHFQKQAGLEIKREMKRATELDHCTFTPQVNPVDQENPILVNTLRVPVYERLLQAKPAPNSMLEKQEYRELKGATFQPDISKSQGKSKWQNDKATPEDRMRSATERLYGDAQIKEKIMCLRQMNQKQQENEVYTFSPNIVSPTKNKENFVKTDLTRSVDRLYDENMRRQRKLLKKEVEVREQELEECTFQPDRPAKNYKAKNENELDELNAHERLYERFKQKKERTNYFTQEKELSQRQDNSLRNRSNSVLEGKTPKKVSKEFNGNGESVNTPAFDRLYKDMGKRKVKMDNLKERVKKEEGTTFQPKTNWSRKSSRSISATNRSQQEIRFSSRYESKYSDGGYIQDPVHQNNRDSEKVSYKRFG